MSRKWTRSDLRGLLQGDPKTLEAWLDENADFLYTGMIYRHRLAPARARYITSNVFRFAVDELDGFRAAEGSMYHWLWTLAAREIEVQKPSSDEPEALPENWATLAPETAEALVGMAEKPLPATIEDDSPAAGLIRAAIADMETEDREILLARYHHLSSESGVSASLNLTTEEAHGRLARARHAFRLKLHGWIRRFVPAVPSPSPSVRTEVFDANLESLFQTVSPVIPLPEDTAARLLESLRRETARISVGRRHTLMQRRIVAFAAASVLIVVLVIIGVIIAPDRADRLDIPPVAEPVAAASRGSDLLSDPEQTTTAPEPPMAPADPQPSDEVLIQRAFRSGVDKDIPALLEILRSGRYAPQIVAAHFLAQHGDASVINPLQEAADEWYSEDMDENPFLKAIETVERRLRQPPPPEPQLEQAQPEGQSAETVPAADRQPGDSAPVPDPNEPTADVFVADPNALQAPQAGVELLPDPNLAPDGWVDEYGQWIPAEQVWPEDQPVEPAVEEDPNQKYLLDSLRPLPADGGA